MTRRMAGHTIAPPRHNLEDRQWHFGVIFSLKLKRHQDVVIKNIEDGVLSILPWVGLYTSVSRP